MTPPLLACTRWGGLLVLVGAAGCLVFDDVPQLQVAGLAIDGGVVDGPPGPPDAPIADAGIDAYAGPDEDGDGIGNDEEGQLLDPPVDTDEDGVPDYLDLDSDGDTILDADERIGDLDPDGDGVRNVRDLNSDADCRYDRDEAGDAVLDTPPVDSDGDDQGDWIEVDADGDWLHDAAEDPDCDGIVDPGESDPTRRDSDGDGFTDLLERAVGTSPADFAQRPAARYARWFLAALGEEPAATSVLLTTEAMVPALDVYFLLSQEDATDEDRAFLAANLPTIIDQVRCATAAPGTPCIPDVSTGAGLISDRDDGAGAYRNAQSITASTAEVASAIQGLDGSGSNEAISYALWATMTGLGTAAAAPHGCTFLGVVPPRTGCPAGSSGYPCFRDAAIPMVVWFSNEKLVDMYMCPAESYLTDAALGRQVRLVGAAALDWGGSSAVTADFSRIAVATGAVADGAPLMIKNAATPPSGYRTLLDTLRTVAQGMPIDVRATATDDDEDEVDAVAAFVDHLEAVVGVTGCEGSVVADIDGDRHAEEIRDVVGGQSLCWRLVQRVNATVPHEQDFARIFGIDVAFQVEARSSLPATSAYFVVPPAPPAPQEHPPVTP